jgi:nitric oxide synthase-interacting protein
MYESILQQKQAIQHEQKMLEQKSLELDQQKQQEELEAKRVILDTFDKTQNSMLGNRQRPTIKDALKDEENSKKRKLDPTDEEELEKTTKQLRKEKEEASKPKIGSFWVPSVTPQADASALKAVKTQVICTAVEKTHSLSIKSLIDVKFQTENTKDKKNVCPACLKSLTNASKLSGKYTITNVYIAMTNINEKLIVLRGCGHVTCNGCVEMFVLKSKKCYVCEKKAKQKDIIDMSPEGTGFASTSKKAMAEKFNLAFQ